MTLILELYRKVWAMWMNLLLEWLLSNIQLPLIGQNLKFMSYYIRLGQKSSHTLALEKTNSHMLKKDKITLYIADDLIIFYTQLRLFVPYTII